MRADEIVRIAKEMPTPDLSHLHTVVSSGGEGDLAAGLTVGWVVRLLQAISGSPARPVGAAKGLPAPAAGDLVHQ